MNNPGTYGHEAIRLSAKLYDDVDEETGKLRDLEDYERVFLADVHTISGNYSRTCGAAVRAFGDRTPAYHATEWQAKRQRDDHLNRALRKYEAFKLAAEEYEDQIEQQRIIWDDTAGQFIKENAA